MNRVSTVFCAPGAAADAVYIDVGYSILLGITACIDRRLMHYLRSYMHASSQLRSVSDSILCTYALFYCVIAKK